MKERIWTVGFIILISIVFISPLALLQGLTEKRIEQYAAGIDKYKWTKEV